MRVLAVGIATLDIINRVSRYPHEDEEVRALDQRRVRGGNATNTLVVLSQRGHTCAWAGVLADEPDSQPILSDLRAHHIDITPCTHHAGGKVPTSYVSLSAETGSRTIVHHRDLPEYAAAAFARQDLSVYDWVHFEGRNVAQLGPMLQCAAEAGVGFSLEVEKPRAGIEALLTLPDLLLFSRAYARHRGFADPADFLTAVAPHGTDAYCAWGEQGAWLRQADGEIRHCPAFAPPRIIDTLGAGDVFNAGVIDAHLRGLNSEAALIHGCRLAGRKCAQEGLAGLQGDP